VEIGFDTTIQGDIPANLKVAEDVYWSVSGDTRDTAGQLRATEVTEVDAVCRTLRQAEEVLLACSDKLVDGARLS